MGKNDKNRPKFPKIYDFFIIPPKNGHKMGTRSGFSMKNSGKCSSEPGENTFKQLFPLKTGWGPRKNWILRARVAILVQILAIFGQNRPKFGIFWSFFRSKNQKVRKNSVKKVYEPYSRLKEECPSVIFLH